MLAELWGGGYGGSAGLKEPLGAEGGADLGPGPWLSRAC